MTYIKTMLDYVFVVATFLLFSCPAVISSKKLITLKSKVVTLPIPCISESCMNPLSANFTKWPNTNNSSAICRRIVLVCLAILWDWCLKGDDKS